MTARPSCSNAGKPPACCIRRALRPFERPCWRYRLRIKATEIPVTHARRSAYDVVDATGVRQFAPYTSRLTAPPSGRRAASEPSSPTSVRSWVDHEPARFGTPTTTSAGRSYMQRAVRGRGERVTWCSPCIRLGRPNGRRAGAVAPADRGRAVSVIDAANRTSRAASSTARDPLLVSASPASLTHFPLHPHNPRSRPYGKCLLLRDNGATAPVRPLGSTSTTAVLRAGCLPLIRRSRSTTT